MPGLRRITICKNPLINDHGAELIAEALKDDLWVKGHFYIKSVSFPRDNNNNNDNTNNYIYK